MMQQSYHRVNTSYTVRSNENKGFNLTFSHPGDKIRYLQALATLGDPPAFQEPDSSD